MNLIIDHIHFQECAINNLIIHAVHMILPNSKSEMNKQDKLNTINQL